MQLTPQQCTNVVVSFPLWCIFCYIEFDYTRPLYQHKRKVVAITQLIDSLYQFQIGFRLKHSYMNQTIQGNKREYEILSLQHAVLVNLGPLSKEWAEQYTFPLPEYSIDKVVNLENFHFQHQQSLLATEMGIVYIYITIWKLFMIYNKVYIRESWHNCWGIYSIINNAPFFHIFGSFTHTFTFTNIHKSFPFHWLLSRKILKHFDALQFDYFVPKTNPIGFHCTGE